MANGRCLCGALRYQVDGPFGSMTHCHCSMCRKHHGAGFTTFVTAPLTGLRWIAGEGQVERYRSSAGWTRGFCRTCGSAAPGTLPGPGLALVPAANLEGDLGITPQAHIFVASKAPWDTIADDLPQYDAYPPEYGVEGQDRPPRTVREGAAGGSCLCGEVRYEATGAAVRMANCHCQRCRLGRGAAHATNVFYRVDQFRWLQGEALVREWKVPDAKFHTVAFCCRCGAKVPRVSPERGIVVVPAGSLDCDPGMRPQAHIWVSEKAPWFTIADSLPQFAAAPPA
jgi:hypothetical protein